MQQPYPRSYTFESHEDYEEAVDRWTDSYESECDRADNDWSEPDDE